MDNCFTSYARIYSLGVHWKVYFRHVLHIRRRQGIPPLSGIRIGIRISWRNGMAADSHGTRVPDAWSAALRQASQFPSRNLAVGSAVPEIWASASARSRRGTGPAPGASPAAGRPRRPGPRSAPGTLPRLPGACRATSGRLPPGGPATHCHNATDRQAHPADILAGSLSPRPRRDGRPRRRTGQDEALPALARRAATGHQTSRSPGTRRPAILARSSPRAGARIHDENQASRGRFR